MTDEKKPFTVTDRRHFTPEGRSRAEDEAPEQAPSSEAPPATPAAAPQPEPPLVGGEERDAGEDDAPGPFPVDFPGLLLSLGAQASLLLGIGLAGVEAAPPPDFEGARAIISLLEVLKDKTEGRRTPEEDRILQGILYELRMAYVSRTRAGGA